MIFRTENLVIGNLGKLSRALRSGFRANLEVRFSSRNGALILLSVEDPVWDRQEAQNQSKGETDGKWVGEAQSRQTQRRRGIQTHRQIDTIDTKPQAPRAGSKQETGEDRFAVRSDVEHIGSKHTLCSVTPQAVG